MLNRKLLKDLRNCCIADIADFRHMGDTVDTKDGQLTYIDNGGDTLAVAHLDYVDWTEPVIYRNKIWCPQLDDRLGVWTLLYLLPQLGVNCDILLTDSEEVGRSTARYFNPTKDYNWIFEFDRRGTDVVLYDYDSKSNRERLEAYGFEVGMGSFSDICYLEDLGVSGWNVGVGYHHEHTRRCYADLIDTMYNAKRFAELWEDHHEELIPAPDFSSSYGWAGDDIIDLDIEDGDYRNWNTSRCPECDYATERQDPYCWGCGYPIEEFHKLF